MLPVSHVFGARSGLPRVSVCLCECVVIFNSLITQLSLGLVVEGKPCELSSYRTIAMLHTIHSVREEGGDIPTQTREQQVANYVGPTLAELGLAQWMAAHGGMVTKCSLSPSEIDNGRHTLAM